MFWEVEVEIACGDALSAAVCCSFGRSDVYAGETRRITHVAASANGHAHPASAAVLESIALHVTSPS
eukprot:3867819-Prymnesium_polylepis.1